MLLAPLQKFALEVHFFVCQLVNIDKALQNPLHYEAFAVAVSPVEIDGTDECFEGITSKEAGVSLDVFDAAGRRADSWGPA